MIFTIKPKVPQYVGQIALCPVLRDAGNEKNLFWALRRYTIPIITAEKPRLSLDKSIA